MRSIDRYDLFRICMVFLYQYIMTKRGIILKKISFNQQHIKYKKYCQITISITSRTKP